jgi:hypothetical protein
LVFVIPTNSGHWKKNSESKNRWFQIFENFQKIKELLGPGKFEKKKASDSKNGWLRVFQKLQRTIGFHERTGNDPAVIGGGYFIFWKFIENRGHI